MKAIEMETVLTEDGKLPSTFQEAFGRKVRVIVLFDDEQKSVSKHQLQSFAGKVSAFASVKDAVNWQQQERNTWQTRESK